jgi:hypothetical protein
MNPIDRLGLAERVRTSLVRAAIEAYEDAALRGLCCEGAWEAAIAAMRAYDLRRIEESSGTSGPG